MSRWKWVITSQQRQTGSTSELGQNFSKTLFAQYMQLRKVAGRKARIVKNGRLVEVHLEYVTTFHGNILSIFYRFALRHENISVLTFGHFPLIVTQWLALTKLWKCVAKKFIQTKGEKDACASGLTAKQIAETENTSFQPTSCLQGILAVISCGWIRALWCRTALINEFDAVGAVWHRVAQGKESWAQWSKWHSCCTPGSLFFRVFLDVTLFYWLLSAYRTEKSMVSGTS